MRWGGAAVVALPHGYSLAFSQAKPGRGTLIRKGCGHPRSPTRLLVLLREGLSGATSRYDRREQHAWRALAVVEGGRQAFSVPCRPTLDDDGESSGRDKGASLDEWRHGTQLERVLLASGRKILLEPR
jgi:hypothetical protein